MSSTADRNTLERVPQLRTLEAAADIYGGTLVAVNAAKKAVPASDAADLLVIGRAEHSAKKGEKITVKAGCFAFDMPEGVTPTLADIGKTVFVADDQTVAFTDTTHAIKAGVVFDVDDEGAWIVTGFQNYLAGVELPSIPDTKLPEIPAEKLPDLSGTYLKLPIPADATADLALTSVTGEAGSEVYASGDGSANLIADLLAIRSKLNAALAVLRSNGFITTAE